MGRRYPSLLRKLFLTVMQVRTPGAIASIFATLLALIVLMSVFTFKKTSELEKKFTQAEQRYHQAGNSLIAVRSDIYDSMFTVQEYLLNPTSEGRDRALDQVSKIRAAANAHLADLEAHFGPTARRQLQQLRDKFGEHWRLSQEALTEVSPGGPISTRLAEGSAALAQALRLTKGMDDLNAANLEQEETEVVQDRRSFHRFLLWLTSLTVAVGLVVSALTLLGLRRYERENQIEKRRREQAEIQLRRLSQQLLKAQEEERKNISRELHDEVGQLLTGLRIELGNAQRSLGGQSPFAERIEEAKTLAEQSLRTARDMAMLLRPSMLDDQGLIPALKWQAKEFSRRFDIPVDVQIQGEMNNLPAGHGVCLYRVVQEALTNCAKHAKAKHIWISVNASLSGVQAIVKDDGVGFASQWQEQSSGIGLLGVSERIRELQGNLKIESEPSRGTCVEVELPLHETRTETRSQTISV
jgi:signal transduction histidine kinase